MNHELPKLPYALDALAPTISKQTLEFHYGKHLQTYITNLNNLIRGNEFENMSLDEIVLKSEGSIFNNAAQTWNHTFYFLSLKPNGGGNPDGKLEKAIKKTWGSFDAFKKDFSTQAVSIFGSGWAWLVADKQGNLSIIKESNAGNPMTRGFLPLLTFDVWEHAYYLDFQNLRADHVNELWKIIDWQTVCQRYENQQINSK